MASALPHQLRPTDLGSAINKDRPDYTVYSGGCTVGRIYETGASTPNANVPTSTGARKGWRDA
jgi:hypothetical protein